MYLQRLYYVASVPTHLFFVFEYLPSISTYPHRATATSPTVCHLHIAHRSLISTCLFQRTQYHFCSVQQQFSSVFRQRRPASPRSARGSNIVHQSYYISHTWNPSIISAIVFDIIYALPTATAPFPAQRRWGQHIFDIIKSHISVYLLPVHPHDQGSLMWHNSQYGKSRHALQISFSSSHCFTYFARYLYFPICPLL